MYFQRFVLMTRFHYIYYWQRKFFVSFLNICKFVWPVCVIFSFAVYPEMFDDLTAHINYFTYTLVAFSTGNVSCQDIKYLAHHKCSYVNAKMIISASYDLPFWYILYFFALNRRISANTYLNAWIDFMILRIYAKKCFWWMFYISGYFTYDVLDMYFNNRLLHDWGVTLHHLIVSTFSIKDSFKYTKKNSKASQMWYKSFNVHCIIPSYTK